MAVHAVVVAGGGPTGLMLAGELALAGVPRIRFHDLRHTHASWLLQDGQPVKVVSERLGHAKTSITMDTYAHLLPCMQDGAAEAVGALLFDKTA